MKQENLISYKLKLINYYNKEKYIPMFESLVSDSKHKDITFIKLIEEYFNNFIDNEKIIYTIESFNIFEIVFYDTLIIEFNKYKIDYEILQYIKKHLFKIIE